MSSGRARLGAWVFAVVTLVSTTVAVLPGEFRHDKRWLELGADETALRPAVLSVIAASTLVVSLLGAGLRGLLARNSSAGHCEPSRSWAAPSSSVFSRSSSSSSETPGIS